MKVCVCKASEHGYCHWGIPSEEYKKFFSDKPKGRYEEVRTLYDLAAYTEKDPDGVIMCKPYNPYDAPCEADLCIRIYDDYIE